MKGIKEIKKGGMKDEDTKEIIPPFISAGFSASILILIS
jgi:hypothetical protein